MPLFSAFIWRFHKAILILSLLTTLGAAFLVSRLKLESDLLALIPKDHPSASAFFDVAEAIGFQTHLVAVVEAPEGADPGRTERFVTRLAGAFAACPLVEGAEYRSGDLEVGALLGQFLPYFPGFLGSADMPKLAERLSDEGIQRQVAENKKILTTPMSLAMADLAQADPLGIRDLFISRMGTATAGRMRGPEPGFYRTSDGRTYFVFLKPRRPAQDMVFSRDLMTRLSRMADEAVAKEREEKEPMPGEFRIRFAGGHAIAVRDESMTRQDIRWTVLSSFLGVMLLFGFSFRTPWILLYVGPPLGAGLLWTLAFGKLVFGPLNVLTLVFSCVLIGLGIDFAIHIMNRYFGEAAKALDPRQRLEKTLRETGAGIIVGALTTAVAFYSIALSDFGGFRQLGLLTGTGILFCLLAMLVVLPSLLAAFAKKTKGRISVAGFGLRPMLSWIMNRPKAILVGSGVLILLLAGSGIRVRFDDNLRNFRPADDEAFELQGKISEWLGGSAAEVLLVVSGSSEAEVMEANTSVLRAMDALKVSGTITSARSVGRYFQAPSEQKKTLQYLKEQPELFNMERIRRTFHRALLENGFEDQDLYEPYLAALTKALSLDKIVLPSRFKGSPFEAVLRPFVYEKGSRVHAVTYITPPSDLWSRSDIIPFRDKILQKLDDLAVPRGSFTLTGASLLTGDLKSLILKGVEGSILLAILGILAVLFVYYRKPSIVLFSCLPLCAALISLAGLMALFGLDLNFFNLIVIPMVIGIGIDDGVHLTNAYKQDPGQDLPGALGRTGRAVVLTSLTTIVGFGSIALAHYPGLRSMGYLAIIAMAACLLGSLLILPALFAILARRR